MLVGIFQATVLTALLGRRWLLPRDPRLGEARRAWVAVLRAAGVVFALLTPLGWWTDARYRAAGVRTTAVVVRKRAEQRSPSEGGTYTVHLVDFEYRDEAGTPHRHTRPYADLLPRRAWDGYAVGDELHPVEYLRTDPAVYRFAPRGPWWVTPAVALVALAAAQLVRWSARYVPAAPEPADPA